MRQSFMMVQHDLFRTTALSAYDKLVLLAIIDVGRSDMPTKWSALSTERMTRHTGLSRTTCYRSTKRLIDLGVLKAETEHLQPTRYQIQWDALDALVDAAAVVQGSSCVSDRNASVSHRNTGVSDRNTGVSDRNTSRPSTRDDDGEYKSISRSHEEKGGEAEPRSPLTDEVDWSQWDED